MAHTHKDSKFLAFYPETTVCAPPADWGASGVRCEFISIELAPKQPLLVDPTAEGNPLAVGKRRKIKGARNVDWTLTTKFHGTGTETAVDAQVAETYLSKLLKWCYGGVHRSNSTTISGPGTATVPIVDDATGIIPGCMIAFEDVTSPNDENMGKLHFRRVLSVNGGTKAVTLSEALPFTPADTDKVHGTLTIYADRSVLKDAVAGPTTWHWLYRQAEDGTDLMWQLEGSVATATFQGLGAGELPSLQLAVMSANFRHSDYDDLSAVTFPAAAGTSAQLVNGRDIQCSIGAYGNTAMAEVEVNAVAFEPGITRSKVTTTTEKIDRFEGLATYSYSVGETKMNMTLVPFDPAWYEGLYEESDYRINYYQPGPGSGPGKAWCFHVAKAQVAATPSRADVGDVNGVAVEFSAMIPSDCSGGSNEHLEQSPFLIALA